MTYNLWDSVQRTYIPSFNVLASILTYFSNFLKQHMWIKHDTTSINNNEVFCISSTLPVRTIFKFRVDLFEAKYNFKNKHEYKKENYMCDSCMSQIDHNTHVLYCPAYATLRQDRNLNNDVHLAQYLQKVLEIRMKLRLDR